MEHLGGCICSFSGKIGGSIGEGKKYLGGKIDLGNPVSRRGKSGPQILGQKLEKNLRIPRIDLEIKRKSTFADVNPDDSAETLRESPDRCFEGEINWERKIPARNPVPGGEEN